MTKARAFSIIELVIVLSIVVIVSAVALPRYWAATARYRVDLAARRMASDLSLAQSRARAAGAFRSVAFDPVAPSYTLPGEPSNTGNSALAYSANLAAEPYATAFRSFTVSDGNKTITFDGYGQPAQSLTATLVCGNHSRTVTVDASSGVIRVSTP